MVPGPAGPADRTVLYWREPAHQRPGSAAGPGGRTVGGPVGRAVCPAAGGSRPGAQRHRLGALSPAPGRAGGGVAVPPGRDQDRRGHRPDHSGRPGGAARVPAAGTGDLCRHPAHPLLWRLRRPGGGCPPAGRVPGRAGAQGGEDGGGVPGPGHHVRHECRLLRGLRLPHHRRPVRPGDLLRGHPAFGGFVPLCGLLHRRRGGGRRAGGAGSELLPHRLLAGPGLLRPGAGALGGQRPAEHSGLPRFQWGPG